jgi:hypothetical protein
VFEILPLFCPRQKKKRRKMMAKRVCETKPVPVPTNHREGGILSRSSKKACISILTLETRAPSKDWREGWPKGRVNLQERAFGERRGEVTLSVCTYVALQRV